VPDELRPDESVVTISELAAEFGVSEAVIEGKRFPGRERIGRTLVEPAVLADLGEQIEDEMPFEVVEELVADAGISDVSAALEAVGYRVEWEGLDGGTVRER
jgi:hypothetical protein